MKLEKVKKAVTPVLERERCVIAAYLYGSRAEGREREESDVDIALLLQKENKLSYRKISQIILDVEDKLEKEVDIRILNNKGIRFIFQVLKTGKPIFTRNKNKRVNFEVLMTKIYLDMKPFFEEYSQQMEKRLTA